MKISLVVTILVTASIAIAQNPPASDPQTPAALAALKTNDTAVQKARETYTQSVKEALNVCIRELDSAFRAVMKAGDLAEANRINAVKTQLEQQLLKAGDASRQDVNDYIGSWRFDNGPTHIIRADGSAQIDGLRGKWFVRDGKLHIEWDNKASCRYFPFSDQEVVCKWVDLDTGDPMRSCGTKAKANG